MSILRVAVPSPLRRSFDYLPPEGVANSDLKPGQRVEVPFGNRTVIGVLLEIASHSDFPIEKLKPALRLLESEATLASDLLSLCLWAARYYQHPIGDVMSQALPVLLRQGEPLTPILPHWQTTLKGRACDPAQLSRAPRQSAALAFLQQGPRNREELKAEKIETSTINHLIDKALVEKIELAKVPAPEPAAPSEQPLQLNAEQQAAVDGVSHLGEQFHAHLLEGVTGSGKTEVYLHLIEQAIEREQQVLVIVPEIGLTPQLLARFRKRLSCPVTALHSGLNDRERLTSWQQARAGLAGVVVGTRSAIFTPFAGLGLIIIDEEHDPSLKQHEGFRYSARDLAVKRAADLDIPILLGSATPSLESLANANSGRYHHHRLTQRAGGAKPPLFDTVDICHATLTDGFSQTLLDAMAQELNAGNQVLTFINRRGYAPALMCHDCGWVGECNHCDARLTAHLKQRALRCHHCDHIEAMPSRCPQCQSPALDFRGPGSERCEQALQQRFPDIPVIRIDRDTTQRKHALRDALDQLHSGDPAILVGTQMLAKGHHLPDVTLVAVVDIDGGLFSADFRGPERMAQLLLQVAGRAGRASKRGRVMIQTHHPEHPILTTLLEQGYAPFAQRELEERRLLGLPPFQHLALVRADAKQLAMAERFLADLRQQTEPYCSAVTLLGPLPAPMTRRAGRFRAQLLLRAEQRADLHRALHTLSHLAEQHPQQNRLRWSIDVDPLEMF